MAGSIKAEFPPPTFVLGASAEGTWGSAPDFLTRPDENRKGHHWLFSAQTGICPPSAQTDITRIRKTQKVAEKKQLAYTHTHTVCTLRFPGTAQRGKEAAVGSVIGPSVPHVASPASLQLLPEKLNRWEILLKHGIEPGYEQPQL